MNIYLDVDGVLLNHDGTLANHADEFLAAMVHSGHPVHWLTTRCRDGDSSAVVAVLGRLVQPPTVELLTSIKPTSWATSSASLTSWAHSGCSGNGDVWGEEHDSDHQCADPKAFSSTFWRSNEIRDSTGILRASASKIPLRIALLASNCHAGLSTP